MRKAAASLASIVFPLALLSSAQAGTLAGVVLPDTVQVAGTTLVLNGLGLRKKFVVKVYVAGLYLGRRSSDADAITTSNIPKRLVMHFVHAVSKNQLVDAFDESFKNNAPNAGKTLKPEIEHFFGGLEDVKGGDEIAFTYIPGAGTTFSIDAKEKLTIAAPEFGSVLFSVWLGPKPPNADLKKGLLGL